jgi:serine protease
MFPNSAPSPLSDLSNTSVVDASLINRDPLIFLSDDFRSGARSMGTLDGTQTYRDSVSSTDTVDYYRFRTGTAYNSNRINISLTNLTSDVDFALYDKDNNYVTGSARGGSWDEGINFSNLKLGQDYYIKVSRYSGDSNYTLSASAGDYSGFSNLLNLENDLGTLPRIQTKTGFLSAANAADNYSFYINGTNYVSLDLTGLSSDADLRLIRDVNSNGIVDDGEELIRSAGGGSTSEFIKLEGLTAGRYIAQVSQYSGSTAYSLTFGALLSSGYAYEGNDTISTASDIGGVGKSGNLVGSRSFGGSVSGDRATWYDLNDFQRFSIATSSDFTATLTGMRADADLQLIRDANYNGIVDAGEVIAFSANGGNLSERISVTNLAAGTYYLQVSAYGSNYTEYTADFSALAKNKFDTASIVDASGDSNSRSVFRDGALKVDFDFAGTANITNVRLEARRAGVLVGTLGSWDGGSDRRNAIVNLDNYSSTMTAGNYEMQLIARDIWGNEYVSSSQSISIIDWTRTNGDFTSNAWSLDSAIGSGAVYLGRGGTDILNLGLDRAQVLGFNGSSLTGYNPLYSTSSQALFGGSSFDFISLADGREIYLQGIEQLQFSDGTSFNLSVTPNDTYFGQQWNLHVSDVDSAWRFTQGSSNVLLASLDTGVLGPVGSGRSVHDMTNGRLVTDATDDDNYGGNGHGHQSISVMSATANNGSGIAGINWNSNIYVNDVYNGVNFRQAVIDSIAYARANNQRVVFQGGIQGEYWLNSGGTQAELEALMTDNADIAFFAIAAGNGNVNVSDTITSPGYSAGVARLQGTHRNVMAVGALTYTGMETINGLANATSVDRASYSNYGAGLTLMAATDSPAIDAFGTEQNFNGTSCANPNMAGIASLVWSVNSYLSGDQLRQLMMDTAMDLGTPGRDDSFGAGLVNADAAVRRSSALNRNYDVANLRNGRNIFA